MYDIRTSAAYSGNITVTFNVPNVADAATCDRLRSLHFENGAWTTDTNAAPSYNAATQICTVSQTVTNLSPFVVVLQTPTIGGQGNEADVATRFTGDGVYQANDPNLIEEFLIFAKSPDPSFNEFQHADCAPYETQGDGRLDITDVNLAEQYLISAVASQTAAGPLQAIIPSANQQEQNSPNLKGKADSNVEKAAFLPRVIKAGDVSTSAGQTIVVPILVDAEGDETGYSFTLDYDPTILTNTAILDGDVGGTRAFVIGNAPNNGVAKGKTTFSLRNFTGGPNGNAVPQGNGQVLVRVQFTVNAGAAAGTTQLTFSGMPTANSITNANSQPLTGQFNPGTVTISGATAAGATLAGRVTTAAGRGIRGASVKLTDSAGNVRTAATTAFGYYRFADVPAGQSYIVSVKAKRYTFSQATRVLNLNADDDSVNFTADGL